MSDPIDLASVRAAKEQPDPEFVRKDEYGRPLYCFTAEYRRGDATYGLNFWAYDAEDAATAVAAMNTGIVLLGQVYSHVPA
jgi:hypothetical protein